MIHQQRVTNVGKTITSVELVCKTLHLHIFNQLALFDTPPFLCPG